MKINVRVEPVQGGYIALVSASKTPQPTEAGAIEEAIRVQEEVTKALRQELKLVQAS